MKIKPFDDNDKYTETAQILESVISQAITPIIHKYADMNYSVRDIQYIISQCANDIMERIITKGK